VRIYNLDSQAVQQAFNLDDINNVYSMEAVSEKGLKLLNS
jgi:hypothetical protein